MGPSYNIPEIEGSQDLPSISLCITYSFPWAYAEATKRNVPNPATAASGMHTVSVKPR